MNKSEPLGNQEVQKMDSQEVVTSESPTKKVITKAQAKERMKTIDSAPDLEKLKTAKVPTRRVRMMMVNPADFMFLFTKGLKFRKNTTIVEGIPEDAQLLTVAADSVRNGIMLVVQSKEYDEIPINVLPPVQIISIKTPEKNTKKKATKRKKK